MKKYILFLLLVLPNLTLLNANESIKIDLKASCSNSKSLLDREFSITMSSNKLHLTKDAIQYNIDGYVDIPEDSYHIKSGSDLYRLDGVVENLNKDNINRFTSYIYNDSEKFITVKEFQSLKSRKDLKLIQKINLQKSNKTKINSLDVYFDENSFNKEYKKCEEQINKSTNNLYIQAILLIFFIFTILFLLKRNFKKK